MNYQRIHDQIIDRAKERVKPSCYCENHHIIPTCLDGLNIDENKVFLTGREHFIVHLLLAKLHPKTTLVHAPWKMACGNKNEKYGKITSRIYATLRQKHAERVGPISSKANKQKVACPWCKKIGGIAIMGRWHFDFCKQNPDGKTPPKFGRKPHSDETKAKMSARKAELKESGWITPLKGKKQESQAQLAGIEKMVETRRQNGSYVMSEEQKKKQSEALKGLKRGTMSEEQKKKISEVKRENAKLKAICPWCSKEGSASAMIRWHFDNCRERKDHEI